MIQQPAATISVPIKVRRHTVDKLQSEARRRRRDRGVVRRREIEADGTMRAMN
jgi:hypothetical protein